MNILKTFLLFLISLFPDLPTITDKSSHIDALAEAVSFVNTFCYLQVVIGCFGIILAVYNVKAIWAAVMWVIRKIPGVN